MNVSGYKDLKKLAEGRERVVYSALKEDGLPVVLKLLRSEHPSSDSIALMYHEFEVGKNLDIPGVIKIYDLIDRQNQYALVLENIEGISLYEYAKKNTISLSLFFNLAIQMVSILGDLHRNNIIHKDIKPSNFIINPATLIIKLTDLNYSSQLLHETQDVVSPNKLEGTLAYMAPEQTGRMNMNIDYRSDFYSLGVTFYEMLSGHLPFENEDQLELLHAHLVNTPPSLSNESFEIPSMLQKIIEKLMEKNPTNRYQSTIGILADLERCQKEFAANGKIEDFPLGENDVFDRLNLSQKLYGREEDVKRLLAVYERVSEGAVEGLMVCGYSGIGKTMLINEVHKPMVRQKGYFISGKFDQLQRNTPYTAITQALNQLARLILAEPEDRFESIKKALQTQLGGVAQVMIDLAPDLELILGPQPALQKLPPQETQARMMSFFKRFMQTVAKADHPLVMFIDDLQWVDTGSLQLLDYILSDDELSHTFLIGAYRENEVGLHHPLVRFFKEMQDQNKIIETLSLDPLTEKDFEALFRDSFHREEAVIKPLAELVHRRTQGNPFFCKQVISKLYQENLLYFNYDARRWDWKLQEIESLKITDNVVDLLYSKLSELPEETQKLLKLAACIGNRFKIETLVLVSGQSPKYLGTLLWPALQMELLLTLRLGYKRVDALRDEAMSQAFLKNITYQFVHDRIQQAVYQGISQEERQKTHLTIARFMIEKEAKACEKEKLFEVTDHFNEAHEILEASEKNLVRNLNYQAGIQALGANAYRPMFNYLKTGLSLCDERGWKDYYELMFKMSLAYSQSLYLTGSIDEGIHLTEDLLIRAQTNMDKAAIYRVRCLHFHAADNFPMAIQSILKALELLGVKMPEKPSTLQIRLKMLQVKHALKDYHLETLDRELKAATDPSILLAFEILSETSYVMFSTPSKLSSYIPLVTIQLMLEYGKSKDAAQFVVYYATVLLLVKKDVTSCRALWKVAERLLAEETQKYSHVYVYVGYAFFFGMMLEAFKDLRKYFTFAVQSSLESGNLASIARTMAAEILCIRDEAKSLRESEAAVLQLLDYSKKTHAKITEVSAHLSASIIKALEGNSRNESEVLGYFQEIVSGINAVYKANAKVNMIWHSYYLESYSKCYEYYISWKNEKGRARFSLGTFCAMTLSALSFYKTQTHRHEFKKILQELEWAARECPVNYQHNYLILCGADADFAGKYHEATGLFEQAALVAKKGDYYLWAALANELAGDLLMREQHLQAAKAYILEAHYYYERYGMGLKVKTLEKRYPHCFDLAEADPLSFSTLAMPTSASLDFMSIIKASQAISGEIVLDKLFKKMLHIVVENAGAERALFLEKNQNTWIVIAKLSHEQDQEKFEMLNAPLKEFENLPQTLIQYSLRSEKAVVLSNAAEDRRYSQDPYILKAKPKSILSLPLLHQNKVVGLLYLENNLTTGAFTQDRVTVLTTLASQIAISLENARHFDEMESLYKSTERFVPKQFLEILHRKTIREIKLGDSLRLNVSVLFSDIRGFTTLLEKLDPDAAFAFVNRFWAVIAPIIRKNRGFINQYQGDGVLALFVQEADDAVLAGLEMHKVLAEFNQEQIKLNAPVLEIGVGINSGPAMIGIIGEKERLEPAVVSDIANTASRVETLNKTYGTHFLISGNTLNALKNKERFSSRIVDKVRPKGKSLTTYLHEIIDWESQLREINLADYLKLYSEAFSDYEAGNFPSAKNKLQSCLNYRPNDPVAKLLSERCDEFIQHGAPAGWDGVYTLTHK